LSALALAVSWLALANPLGQQIAEPPFVVIVNASNPEKSADAETLIAAFLKQKKKWRNGETILPIDQSVVSPLRRAFAVAIFGQQPSAIQAYWQGEVAAHRDSPPPVRTTDQDVLAFVAANVGAVGYVNSSAKLPPQVKILRFEH
jgi:ABC-type phosphate transport system substrate-binding protein